MNKNARKIITGAAAITLIAGISIGGTLAWLQSRTETLTNTFTFGDVNITLSETTGTSYKCIPGTDIEKDPKVTVQANSENCYVYIKVEEKNWIDKLTYELDSDSQGAKWLPVGGAGNENVYYYKNIVPLSKSDTVIPILKNNKVVVSDTLTKRSIKETDGLKPELKFTAYAIQSENTGSAVEAWANVNK